LSISPDAKRIAGKIIEIYGSDSGILFGIPPERKYVIEAIVQIAIEIFIDEKKWGEI